MISLFWSKCGLMKALYIVIKDGLGKTCWNFHNKPIVLFTLVKIVLIWKSKDNFESKCRSKCFWELALLTGILLKNILGWMFLVVILLKMTSWACFVGSWLKLIFHWKAHSFISFRSLFRLLAVLSGTLTVENRVLSSANNLGLLWRLSDKSLMYMRNKSGPNIEPWGIPALTLAQVELWPLRITLCFLFFKKSVKRLNKLSIFKSFYVFQFCGPIWWFLIVVDVRHCGWSLSNPLVEWMVEWMIHFSMSTVFL